LCRRKLANVRYRIQDIRPDQKNDIRLGIVPAWIFSPAGPRRYLSRTI
jgi:hypothetical protein